MNHPAHSHMSATPANQQQLPLRGSWPVLLPDVHGKERGAAVEDGRQRRHQSGHHHSYHKSPKACKNAYADTQMHVKTPEKCCVSAWEKKNIFSPLGMSSMTSLGKAMLEHPTSAPHTRTHSSGSTQPTESETWRRSQKLFACRSGR